MGLLDVFKVAAPIIGGIFGSKGGDKPAGTTTQTQKIEPWAASQPYLRDILGDARKSYNRGGEYYPFSTYIPQSNQTEKALQLTEDRALSGSPLVNAAKDEFGKTIGGEYLGENNPYLKGIWNDTADDVTSRVGSLFSNTGMYGSSNHKEELSEGLGRARNSLYAPAYENERSRMSNASIYAPTLANNDYSDIGKLMAVGQGREAYGEAKLNDMKARHDYSQDAPWDYLNRYTGVATPISGQGSSGTSENPYFQNKTAGAFGGAMLGSKIGQGLGSLFNSGSNQNSNFMQNSNMLASVGGFNKPNFGSGGFSI